MCWAGHRKTSVNFILKGNSLEKVIIIGGLPRSGKTLLSNVIGSNSQIAIAQSALNFFHYFSRKKYKERGDFAANLDWFFHSCRKSEALGIIREDVILTGVTRKDLYMVLLDTFRQKYFPEKKYYGEYTHLIEENFPILIDWFGIEKIKYIQFIRNPYDNYASYMTARNVPLIERKKYGPRAFVYKFCSMWKKSASIGLSMSQRYPDNCKVMFFEKFRENPIKNIEILCKWIGVETEIDRMFNMTDYQKKRFNTVFDKNGKKTGCIMQSQIDRKSLLFAHEIKAIQAVCSEFSIPMGFDDTDDGKFFPVDWKKKRSEKENQQSFDNCIPIFYSYLSEQSIGQTMRIVCKLLPLMVMDICGRIKKNISKEI